MLFFAEVLMMKGKSLFIYFFIIIFSCINVFASDNFKMCANGHKNLEKAKFCVYCGLPLESGKSSSKEIKPNVIKSQSTNINEGKYTPQKSTEVSPEKSTVLKKSFEVICSKCGKKITNPKIKFCTTCGNNLLSNQSAQSVETSKQKDVETFNKSTTNEIKTSLVKTTKQIAEEQKEELRKAEEEKLKIEEAKIVEEERKLNEESKKADEIRQKVSDLLKKGEEAFKNKYPRIALKFFEDAIKIIPDCEDAIYNSGIICYYLKNYSDANLYFEMLLKKNNKDFEVLIYNGLTLYKLGLFEESKLTFKRILAFSDINSDYYKKAKEFFEKVR